MTAREWIDPRPVDVPGLLKEAVGGHPLVAQTLVRRGIDTVGEARAFLDPDHYTPASPFDLPGMAAAVERVERAVADRERICVWGDFDVDGQTATSLLVSTLRDLGGVVRYHIPRRATDSHGIQLRVLKPLLDEGVELLLTCDTGVTAHEPIAYARAQGVDVVVTDHHLPPETLPDANAVVNPRLTEPDHPLHELPGVGCAYQLAVALYEWAGRPGDAAQLLDLVALGIVADVATLTGDTRYLLQRGLVALRGTRRLGLRALIEVAGLNQEWITEGHIGFALAPRLNALGRLSDANAAVELLTTTDPVRARVEATALEGLNAERRLLTTQVAEAAQAQIERDPSLLTYAALVLSDAHWPAGVVGIVANRLAEQYNRPVVLIAAPPGQLARGSARSIEGCDITAAIAAHADLLERFGGHPMAAGLAIEPERIPAFRRALSTTVERVLAGVEVTPRLEVDGYLELADLTLELVEQFERLAPFGPGNPPLTLATRDVALVSRRLIGRGGEHLLATVEDRAGATQKVVWWGGGGRPLPEGRFDLGYTVRAGDYRGQREVQVEWVDARPLEEPVVVLAPVRPTVEAVDLRWEPNRRRLLDRLRAREEVTVWAEAQARVEVDGVDRRAIDSTKKLAIWTTPPGPDELSAVLERAGPQTVYLFGIDPDLDRLDPFLHRLAGLVKTALRVDAGRVEVARLAAATAQREATVRQGLAWLAAHGHVTLVDEDDGVIELAPGSGEARPDRAQMTARLRALLAETAAYRSYFARADRSALV